MKNGAWILRWRQFTVDLCIAAATVAVAFAATGMVGDVSPLLLIAGALVGIALILAPDVTARSATGIGRQSLQLPIEREPARPMAQAMERFDPAIGDATSV